MFSQQYDYTCLALAPANARLDMSDIELQSLAPCMMNCAMQLKSQATKVQHLADATA